VAGWNILTTQAGRYFSEEIGGFCASMREKRNDGGRGENFRAQNLESKGEDQLLEARERLKREKEANPMCRFQERVLVHLSEGQNRGNGPSSREGGEVERDWDQVDWGLISRCFLQFLKHSIARRSVPFQDRHVSGNNWRLKEGI